MSRKGITSYLAGFCVTALLAGSLAVPPAAFGSSHGSSAEQTESGTKGDMKEKRGYSEEHKKDMNTTEGKERGMEHKQKMEPSGEEGHGEGEQY